MAFNINAQIILQAPNNVKAITSSIQSQLQGVSVNVVMNIPKSVQQQLNILNTSLKQLNQNNQNVSNSGKQAGNALNNVGKSAKNAGGAMHMLGKETALTFKRFAAAGLVTATFFRMTQAISEAIPKALEFQREMVRLEQITGKTGKQLALVSRGIRELSTSLGVDANELANISKIFAQTGQSIKEVQASVRAIARSSLAPTFGEMAQTAEGLVAALNQFNIKASQSEAVLGSLNRVSKKFAVESSDLVAAIRRAGGVFAIAAGDTKKPIQALQEFTAVFTAVRSTTRESAETVATGLRTIFTRLQRRGTIDALKSLGINLTDANGKFIGLFESFRTLSRELDGIIQKGDAVTLSGITEELGGMRQVGKLIPAIKEFRKAEAALLEAQKGAQEGLGGDVAKGLTPLIKQFEIVRERFNELIRGVAESGAFKVFAKTAIGLANAFLSLGEALTPLLPTLTALAGIKIGRSLSGFASGFFGSFGGGGGVKAVGQTAGASLTGGGKGAANTASNTQALTNLVSALGTNSTALKTSNTSLVTVNTSLNSLKAAVTLLGNSMASLTAAVQSSNKPSSTVTSVGSQSGGGQLSGALGGLKTSLATNSTAIASNTTNLATMNNSFSSFKATIGPVKNAVVNVTTAMNNLKGAVASRVKDTVRITAKLTQNTTALTTNTAALGTNTSSLGTLNSTFGTFKSIIGSVKSGLTAVVGAVNKLGSSMSGIKSALATNTTALGTNTTALGTNTANLGTNTSALGTTRTFLGTNSTALGTMTVALNALKVVIGSNSSALINLTVAVNSLRTALSLMMTRAAGPVGGGIYGGKGAARGPRGPRRGFASGGLVPGSGNRDTVPAMLTPGEFVIRKSAVNSVGTGALSDINGYADGGIVVNPKRIGVVSLAPPTGGDGLQSAYGRAKITNPEAIRRLERTDVSKKALNNTEANAFLNGSLNSQAKALGIDTNKFKTKSALATEVSRITGAPRGRTSKGKLSTTVQNTTASRKTLAAKYKKNPKMFGKGALRKGGFAVADDGATFAQLSGEISTFTPGLQEQYVDGDVFEEKIHGIIKGKIQESVQESATTLAEDFLIQPIGLQTSAVSQSAISSLLSKGSGAINSITGFMLEGIVGALTGAPVAGSEANFDFPMLTPQTRENLANLFSPNNPTAFATMLKLDAKKKSSATFGSLADQQGVAKKIINDINMGNFAGVKFTQAAKMASGGMAQGTDTVPAMLTPGEYVINKGAAKAFGYGNLKNINRYQAGGVVKRSRGNYGIQAGGGLPDPGGMQFSSLTALENAAENAANGINNVSQATRPMSQSLATNARAQQTQTKLTNKRIRATGKLKEATTKMGGSALNAFFGLTTLQSGFQGLTDGTTSLSMSLVNLAFGASMLIPAIGPMTDVIGKATLAFTALKVEQGGFLLALKFSAKKLMTSFMELGPLAKAGIVGAIGIAGGMLADFIADKTLGKKETIGQTGTVKGRRGVTGSQAGTAGAISGGIQGVGLGAAAGFMVGGPLVAALGGAIGGLTGAVTKMRSERKAQEDFTALLRLSDAMDNFAEKFGIMGQDIVLNSMQMREATEATGRLTAELTKEAAQITDFKDKDTFVDAGAGSGAGETFSGSRSLDSFSRGTSGDILGATTILIPKQAARADTIAGGAGLNMSAAQPFQGDLTTAEKFQDIMTDGLNNAFGTDFASSAERRFIDATEGLSTIGVDAFKEVDLEIVGEQLRLGAAAAGEFFQQKIQQVSTSDLANLSTDFSDARQELIDLGVDISGFEDQIDASVTAAVLGNVTKASRSSSKQQQEMAGAYTALAAKAKGTGESVEQIAARMDPTEFANFAASAGLVTGNAKAGAAAIRLMVLEEKKRLTDTIPAQIIMQEKLARAEAIANAALNDYVSSFTRFGAVIESESVRLTNMVGLLEGSLDSLTGANFDTADRFNPFDNVDAASFDEIGNAISRIIENTGGGGRGFQGLKEIVAIQKNLPDVLKKVTKQSLSQPKAQTQEDVATSLREGLAESLSSANAGLDIANVPPQVMESLNASIAGLIGNRQDSAGTTEDELKRLFQSEDFEQIMQEFSDATEPVLEALSTLDSAITEYEKAQIGLIKIQTEFANKEIEARLRQIDVINKTSDALDKFRPGGGPKNTVARAEDRVLKRQQDILKGSGGAAATTSVLDQQQEVARLREKNREIRQRIADSGGPRIGADVKPGTGGAFQKVKVEQGQKDLLANSQALNAHEQALQTLISSTDMLDATIAELNDIEKSRMDSRQIASFEAKRMSTVLKETDPVKRAKLMEEQFAGDRAFNKLQGGEALMPKDIAALIDGGLERRLAIGVASGDITEEDAENRRAQFSQFLSQTGLPGMNQMLGAPFDQAAMDQLIRATQLGGTAQGSTDKEKTLIEEAKKLAQEKADAIDADIKQQADAFKLVVTNAQTELANFSNAVAAATKKVNDAQIKMDAELLEAQKLRESASQDQLKIKGAEPQAFQDEAKDRAAEGRKEAQENRGDPTRVGIDRGGAQKQEELVQQKLEDMQATDRITFDQAMDFGMSTSKSDKDLVTQMAIFIEAINEIDKLVAAGTIDRADRSATIDKVLGAQGGFSATDAAGNTDPALKPLEDMSHAMLNPGSIFVHDVYVEKLLMEVVKLLGGNEEHLKRAKDAAEAQLAGLKSPTGGLGVAAGNLGALDPQSIIEQEMAKRGVGGTPAQQAEAKAIAEQMGAGGGLDPADMEKRLQTLVEKGPRSSAETAAAFGAMVGGKPMHDVQAARMGEGKTTAEAAAAFGAMSKEELAAGMEMNAPVDTTRPGLGFARGLTNKDLPGVSQEDFEAAGGGGLATAQQIKNQELTKTDLIKDLRPEEIRKGLEDEKGGLDASRVELERIAADPTGGSGKVFAARNRNVSGFNIDSPERFQVGSGVAAAGGQFTGSASSIAKRKETMRANRDKLAKQVEKGEAAFKTTGQDPEGSRHLTLIKSQKEALERTLGIGADEPALTQPEGGFRLPSGEVKTLDQLPPAAQRAISQGTSTLEKVPPTPVAGITPEQRAALENTSHSQAPVSFEPPKNRNNQMMPGAGAGGAMGAAGGGEEGINIRTLVDAINSLNQVTINVAIAPINVTLNTGGLADQLRVIIGKEALKALKGDKMNNAIDARIQNFVESTPAG